MQESIRNTRIKNNVKWLNSIKNNNSKLAIENNNYFPTGAYEHVTDTEFLNSITNKFSIFILFDYSHAKITSYNKKILFEKYFMEINHNRIIQIHFCGFSIKNKIIYDSHYKPKVKDYINLQKIISRLKNLQFITIEYYKNIGVLENICNKIKKMNKNIL